MSSSAAGLKLLDLIHSHRVTAAIYVAAKLGIADLLSGGPKSLDELVQATGADRAALARLLAVLVTIGICARAEGDRHALGETGTALVGDASPSFKAFAIFEGELLSRAWSGMLETVMTGKTALRAVWQAEITLTDVRVPAENKLAECHSFKDVSKVLDRTRYTVAWRALGLATASYELALAHALRREQFGQPIAGYQLVQDKLARMLAEITSMQLMCWRLSKLADAGRMTAAMASLAKMNHAAKARAIVADARDILGGDGILLDHHVARHHADMEAIFTFEGTDSVQALIVGREITGLSAISGRRPTR